MTTDAGEVKVTLRECPFCGEHLSEPIPVQHPKSGLAMMHPGCVADDDCPLSGWGFYEHQLDAWNTRAAQSELLALVGEAVEALERAEKVFAHYADLHKAKGNREGDQKAAVNLGHSMDMGEVATRLRAAFERGEG